MGYHGHIRPQILIVFSCVSVNNNVALPPNKEEWSTRRQSKKGGGICSNKGGVLIGRESSDPDVPAPQPGCRRSPRSPPGSTSRLSTPLPLPRSPQTAGTPATLPTSAPYANTQEQTQSHPLLDVQPPLPRSAGPLCTIEGGHHIALAVQLASLIGLKRGPSSS